MRRRSVTAWLVALVLAAALAPALAPAQPPPAAPAAWQAFVRAAPVGARVAVTRTDAVRLRGTLLGVDSASLTLGRDGARQLIGAAEVRRVARDGVRRRRVLRYGLPFGLLAGGAAVAAIDAGSRNPEPVQAFLMGGILLGAPAGALIAGALPVGPPLYDASPAARIGVRRF